MDVEQARKETESGVDRSGGVLSGSTKRRLSSLFGCEWETLVDFATALCQGVRRAAGRARL
jgi:hypothetical protein